MVDVLGVSAKEYWTSERSKEYESKRNVQKTQERMTRELLALQPVLGFVLDAGCGSGFSTRVLKQHARTIGIDISEHMCVLAREKGLDVVCADFSRIPFKTGSFDFVVSISALQWATGRTRDELLIAYANVLFEFNRVLKSKGRVLLQFYPGTQAEFDVFLGLAKRWFKPAVHEVGSGKNAKRYVVLKKKK
ncbi:hypothetical protein COT72_01955 [archaeon CG10_big_fil_rev_8_21_14_0_10_43_11]|nr:MAG: hypothetical protein COT72_01955 [archaeon CG10_big_fil_rev_8_21_14_0_10_43_11]